MIFVGDDWAEAHHDVCLMDEGGTKLAAGRLPEGLEGVARLHQMIAEHTSEAAEVVVGIEVLMIVEIPHSRSVKFPSL